MSLCEARCGCGGLAVRAEGEPVRISVCHCLECKRRGGSAFSWNAHFAAARVEIDGPYRSFTRGSDDGYWARFHFCGECGVTVFYEIERRPGIVSIPAGAFADPHFAAPGAEAYEERRCPWLPPLDPSG